MDKKKLESKMKLKGLTGGDMAELLNMSRSRFSLKINGNDAEFTQSEIDIMKGEFDLSPEEVIDIFFS